MLWRRECEGAVLLCFALLYYLFSLLGRIPQHVTSPKRATIMASKIESINSSTRQTQTQHSHIAILEIYHLTRIENFNIWVWRMKNVLERDDFFVHCTKIATMNMNMTTTKIKRRTLALGASNGSPRNITYKLIKRYNLSNKPMGLLDTTKKTI